MWWIFWLIPMVVFTALLACCKISGDESRNEEKNGKVIWKGKCESG